MGLIDCLGHTDKKVPKEHLEEIKSAIEGLIKKGMPENEAEMQAAKDFHKKSVDNLNTLKKELKVKTEPYKKPDQSKIKSISDEYGKRIGEKKGELEKEKKKAAFKIDDKERNDRVNSISDKIDKGEPINENELEAARNDLYDVLDAQPDAAHLIEPLINKIEGYENRTKTKVSQITKEGAVKSAGTDVKPKRTVSKSIEQWEGSRATTTDPNGKKVTGIIKKDSRGIYSLYDNSGKKIAVIGEKAITDRDITLPSKEDVPRPIDTDADGNIKSITLQLNKVDKERGGLKKDKLITIEFKDPEKALDYAIQLRAEQVGEFGEPEFERIVEEVKEEVPVEKTVEENKQAAPIKHPEVIPETKTESSNIKPQENASPQTNKQQQASVQQSSKPEYARTEQAGSEVKTAEAKNSNSNQRSEKQAEKVEPKDIGDKARELAAKLRSGEVSALPAWLQASLPKGTQKQGVGLNEAFAFALEAFDDTWKATKDFAKAIEDGFDFLKQWFEDNKVPYDEAALKEQFRQDRLQASGVKEPPAEPPKQPPLTPMGAFSSLPPQEKIRGAFEHLINSNVDPDIMQKFRDGGYNKNGIKYQAANNQVAQNSGKAIIKTFGADEALQLARLDTFHPSVNSAVFAEAINHFQELETLATTPAEKLEYANKWANTYDEYAETLTGKGQFSSYAYQFYKTSKLGFLISADRKFEAKREQFTSKAEKTLKEIISDIENEPEFKEYLKGKVAEEYFKDKSTAKRVATKLNDVAAKIRKDGLSSIFPDWAKANTPSGTQQSGIGGALDEIVATAIETISKGIIGGEKIADLIKDAVTNIKSGGATATDKEISDALYSQFKGEGKPPLERYKESLRNQVKDLNDQIAAKQRKAKNQREFELDDEAKQLIEERNAKRKQLNEAVPLEQSAKRILDKWDKRLSKLQPDKRKELLSKVLSEITEHGGLDLDTFKKMYADALGLPSLTPEMKTKLLDLGGKLNEVDKATESMQKNPTPENIDAYLKAMREGERASAKLNDIFGEKGITLDRFLSIAKLNTLGVANLLMNPLYNINFLPFRFAESLTKMGLDYGLKYIGFARDKDGVYENTFYKQFGYYGGFAEGVKSAARGIVEGQQQLDYFKNPTKQNIRPLESVKEILAHYKGEKRLTGSELANAVLEAFPTMGGSAAMISRGLQIGDSPFRIAAEKGMAESIARQRGLKGDAKRAFVLAPDEASAQVIKDSGERAVMAQDNFLTDQVKRISNAFKGLSGTKTRYKAIEVLGKLVGATTQPFVKIPLNNAMTVAELAVPELAFAKGMWYALRGSGALKMVGFEAKLGDRDEALNAFSRMAVGIAIGAAYSQIAKAGLITSTSDDKKKINISIAKEDVYGGNHLNYTGFKRWLSGGSAEFEEGDATINLNALGISGNIMNMYASKYDKMPPSDWEKMPYIDELSGRLSSSFVEGLKNNVFSNTGTLMDALNSGSSYSTNKWLRNSSNVLFNAFDPSWLAQASKSSNNFKVDYTAMGLKEQIASSIKERLWMKDDLPKSITVWGEPRKYAPEGSNPYLYYYFNVGKTRTLDEKDWGYNVLALYNKTKDDSVVPERPQKTIRQGDVSYQLDSKQYEQFQVLVGQNRAQLTQALMNMKVFQDATDEQKIQALKIQYKQGYDIGKNQFIIKNPGFLNPDKK